MALAVPPHPHAQPTDAQPTDSAAEPGATAFAMIEAGFEALRDVEITDSQQLASIMAGTERVTRQGHALSIDLMEISEQARLHYDDGHSSAKVMSRHVNKLSGGEAAGREKCRVMFKQLTDIATTARAGALGKDQTMLLGRVFANKRVRGAMEGRQAKFIRDAKRLSFPRFQQRLLEWERLIDEDGPEPPGDRAIENRTANLTQNAFDLSWDLTANFPSVDGAFVNDVHRAYTQALFDADWAEAKARVGDTVCIADLARTHAQRKADAWVQICADAAANKNGMAPVAAMTHNIRWSASAYEEMARRFAGAPAKAFDVGDYCCETIDGHPVDPTEAFANSVLNKIRRVVVDAKGVVLDMGHARNFTGLARTAVQISGRECFWPGCWQPATGCEIDHLHEHCKGGRTCPGNGAPCCGRHNRLKQQGYKVWRDSEGQIHVQRPNGTVLARLIE